MAAAQCYVSMAMRLVVLRQEGFMYCFHLVPAQGSTLQEPKRNINKQQ